MTADTGVGSGDIVVTRIPHPARSERATSTDGRIVYAVGDVHGCYDLLAGLLEAIVDDIATRAGDLAPLLVFCGDYVDRGPRTSDVLAALVWMSRHAGIDVVTLRGNHEAMLLDFLDHPERNLSWLRRAGRETLASYGVPPFETDLETLEAACFQLRDQLIDRMPVSHLELLRALPLTHICGDYIFVHAGLAPGVPLAQQDEEDCLWIRGAFLTADYRFEKVVVHGHSWSTEAPVVTRNRIGIDTGAYATGVLTAVRLDGPHIAFLQSRRRDAALPEDVSRSVADPVGEI